jgi:hypothetical protein
MANGGNGGNPPESGLVTAGTAGEEAADAPIGRAEDRQQFRSDYPAGT